MYEKIYKENYICGNFTIIKLNDDNSCILRCKCGNEFFRNNIKGISFIQNKSCPKCYKGIIKDDKFKKIYKTWAEMKNRCYNKNYQKYKNWGGRGIRVCKEWLEDFLNFYNWSLANGFKQNLSIDRINVNGNYEPSNCRWITMAEQAKNKTTTVKYNFEGENYTVEEIAKKFDLTYNSAYLRIRRKWNNQKIKQKYNQRGHLK